MSDCNDTPSNRWDKLSAALSHAHNRGWEKRTNAAWLAQALATSLTEYVGIPIGRDLAGASEGIKPIVFYSYKAGYSIETDSFEQKDNAFDAIGIDVQGFHTFGLGIQLEMGRDTLPRYNLHWSVRVKIDDSLWRCQTCIGTEKTFELKPPVTTSDIQPIVEAIYEGLLDWLERIGSEAPREGRIGFSQA